MNTRRGIKQNLHQLRHQLAEDHLPPPSNHSPPQPRSIFSIIVDVDPRPGVRCINAVPLFQVHIHMDMIIVDAKCMNTQKNTNSKGEQPPPTPTIQPIHPAEYINTTIPTIFYQQKQSPSLPICPYPAELPPKLQGVPPTPKNHNSHSTKKGLGPGHQNWLNPRRQQGEGGNHLGCPTSRAPLPSRFHIQRK